MKEILSSQVDSEKISGNQAILLQQLWLAQPFNFPKYDHKLESPKEKKFDSFAESFVEQLKSDKYVKKGGMNNLGLYYMTKKNGHIVNFSVEYDDKGNIKDFYFFDSNGSKCTYREFKDRFKFFLVTPDNEISTPESCIKYITQEFLKYYSNGKAENISYIGISDYGKMIEGENLSLFYDDQSMVTKLNNDKSEAVETPQYKLNGDAECMQLLNRLERYLILKNRIKNGGKQILPNGTEHTFGKNNHSQSLIEGDKIVFDKQYEDLLKRLAIPVKEDKGKLKVSDRDENFMKSQDNLILLCVEYDKCKGNFATIEKNINQHFKDIENAKKEEQKKLADQKKAKQEADIKKFAEGYFEILKENDGNPVTDTQAFLTFKFNLLESDMGAGLISSCTETAKAFEQELSKLSKQQRNYLIGSAAGFALFVGLAIASVALIATGAAPAVIGVVVAAGIATAMVGSAAKYHHSSIKNEKAQLNNSGKLADKIKQNIKAGANKPNKKSSINKYYS